jgi:transposase-like protein
MICSVCKCSGHRRGRPQQLASGRLVQRFRCSKCARSWTIDESGVARPRQTPLSDEAVLYILTADESQVQIALNVNRSTSLVSNVRRGLSYRDIHPDVPRNKPWGVCAKASRKPKAQSLKAKEPKIPSITCVKCIHYLGSFDKPCGLGHPDPVEEGLRFAADCSTYIETS